MRYIILFITLLTALSAAQPAGKSPSHPHVILQTTQGSIELELFDDTAPLAVENFITHAKNGYYNGIVFHRIIKNFMIQGGDPTGTGRGGESIWHKPFKDEFKPGLVFDRPGILAMANAGPMTNGSQFFITTAPTPWLNGHHTIFGKVVKGMDTLKRLNNVPTSGRRGRDRPLVKQEIIKATVVSQSGK
ncbi:MAG: peptidylprolyl isomerase [Helicobacteraceae bacterium 4484_230]|nr:MAG: peptidylprolyl isomerase [Helicobacteraceae bacterium 4484_230]